MSSSTNLVSPLRNSRVVPSLDVACLPSHIFKLRDKFINFWEAHVEVSILWEPYLCIGSPGIVGQIHAGTIPILEEHCQYWI